jgi:putative ABC transport system permease protein
MIFWESLRIALKSLRTNRMRSFLTALGIIIGVASLITMLAVGAGAQTQVAEQIRTIGANVLMVAPAAAQSGGIKRERGSGHRLTESDAVAIAAQLPQIQVAAPSIRGSAQIVSGDKNWNTTVNGTSFTYFVARDWSIDRGRYFLGDEERGAGKVAVIGVTVAKQLFGSKDPLRQQIRIARVPFTVIGTLAAKGSSGLGNDQDDIVFVPISTARVRLMGSANQVNPDSVAYILVKVGADQSMDDAMGAIEALLKQRHRIEAGHENDFEISSPAAAMTMQRSASGTIAWLLAAIASVSLIVGGISIMNIMLVSVSERTREIGLRISVGARRRDIRAQFIAEAVSLCLVGGIIGVAVGSAAAWAVAELAGWPIYLGPDAMLSAVGFAALVGVFFGYFPARKAAKLEPAVALRSE